MPNYRRAFAPGASWFFTVNLLQRRRNDLLLRHVELLRDAVRRVHRDYPFTIDAWVVLPNTCIAYGRCRLVMRITRCAGG